MDWKMEVVTVPASDAEGSKKYYAEQLGFAVDLDTALPGDTRLVQLTPPGSGCSIHLNTGLKKMPAGILEGLQLVVSDIEAAHERLIERDVGASPIQHFADGEWDDGRGEDWNSFIFFNDPDGNGWVMQERPASS